MMNFIGTAFDKVPTNLTSDFFHPNPSKVVDNVGLTNHFVEPVLDGSVPAPPILWTPMPGGRKNNGNEKFAFPHALFSSRM